MGKRQYSGERARAFSPSGNRLSITSARVRWSTSSTASRVGTPRTASRCGSLCSRAYHALFMQNLLIRPTDRELEDFGEPDFVIYNAGDQRADRRIPGVSSSTSVMLNFERREMVLLGTNYAGEMKKGVFTAMNYWMPKSGVLSMHCSANQGARVTPRCSSGSRAPEKPRFLPTRAAG